VGFVQPLVAGLGSNLIGLDIGVMPIPTLCFHYESHHLWITESRTSRPTGGEFPMRTMIFAAAAVLALGMGAASAQGIGAGVTAPNYGQKWAEMQQAEHLKATAQTATPEKYAHAAPFWNFWSKRGN
jgi:hypothetical protein